MKITCEIASANMSVYVQSITLQLHQAPIAAFPETSVQDKIFSFTLIPKQTHACTHSEMGRRLQA